MAWHAGYLYRVVMVQFFPPICEIQTLLNIFLALSFDMLELD